MATLDFVENAAIWTFAGLLAVSGSPLAAIAFLTIAPKFVIAMRTGDFGAIVTIFVDGVPAAVVDTHADAPGMLFKALVGDPANDTHQIYIQKDDNPDTIIEVVRKELSADELTTPGLRYDSGSDTVQQEVAGAWVDNPAADPRISPSYTYPALTTSDPACDSSANMVAAIKNIIDSATAATTLVQMASVIYGVLIVAFPPLLIFDPLVLALADVIITATQAGVEAAFSPTVYADLLCDFRVNVNGSTGAIDSAGLDAVRSAIAAHEDGTVIVVTEAIFAIVGWVGVNNWGASGTETGDCIACLPQDCFSWLTEMGDVFSAASYIYEGGAGWCADHNSGGATLNVGANYNTTGMPASIYKVEIDVSRTALAIDHCYLYMTNNNTLPSGGGQTLIGDQSVVLGTGTTTLTYTFTDADYYGVQIILQGSPATFDCQIQLVDVRLYSHDWSPSGLAGNCGA